MSQSQEMNQIVLPQDMASVCLDPETEELLEHLRGMVVQFQRLIDCRSRESLQQPGHDGHWGVVEVLCYLRDWEGVIHDRVRRITEEHGPVLEEPDTTMWPLEHDYGAQDSYVVFQELAALRESLLGTLRDLAPSAWDRTGVFEGRGSLALRDYLREVVSHDARYVQEARDALA